jgi:four helix bundle protein
MPNDLAEQLKKRALPFSVRVMHFCHTFHQTWEVRSSRTSSSAHPQAQPQTTAPRAARDLIKDFTNKLGMAVEEADESEFWLMFVGQSGIRETAEQEELLAEAGELLAIFAKSAKTASQNDHHQ